jgi:divalent metal cation (Fe/Co/Zn/Cd) transporter
VHPKISVSEGHRISEAVRAQIIRNVDAVTDVMVHIDPEDDEIVAPSHGLPLRSDVIKTLNKRWEDVKTAQYIEETVLHYLDGKIHVELLLPLERMGDISDSQAIAKKLKELAEEEDCIADVQVRFH